MSQSATIKLAIKALLEVVESGSKNVEIAVLKFNQPMEFMKDEDVEAIVQEIEEEKKQEEEQKKGQKSTGEQR